MPRVPRKRVTRVKSIKTKRLKVPTIQGGVKMNLIKNNKVEINDDEVKLTGLITMEKRIRNSMKKKSLTEKDIRHILGTKYEN